MTIRTENNIEVPETIINKAKAWMEEYIPNLLVGDYKGETEDNFDDSWCASFHLPEHEKTGPFWDLNVYLRNEEEKEFSASLYPASIVDNHHSTNYCDWATIEIPESCIDILKRSLTENLSNKKLYHVVRHEIHKSTTVVLALNEKDAVDLVNEGEGDEFSCVYHSMDERKDAVAYEAKDE
jgi:hypothetical protein